MKADLNYNGDSWPIYAGFLRIVDENEAKRHKLILKGLNLIKNDIPQRKTFRLHYAGNLLRCKALNRCNDISEMNSRYRNIKLIAELMMINGEYLCPFIRIGNKIVQV